MRVLFGPVNQFIPNIQNNVRHLRGMQIIVD